MGKLIVIEGLDGCGKSTQLDLLPQNLKREGIECKSVSFPNYESDSSALVKMYLAGQFGSRPGDVNPYAASSFYAVDRYASFKQDWGEYYKSGGVIVSGRYTTSNAVHQCSKLDESEWENFLSWLYDFEFLPLIRLFSSICPQMFPKNFYLTDTLRTADTRTFTKATSPILTNAERQPFSQQIIRVGAAFPAPKTATPEALTP